MAINPAAYIDIACDDPPTQLRVLLDADRPEISAGYGGWQEVARPGRSTVTTWQGQPARRMAVAILFDNFTAGTSLEGDITKLEHLGLPTDNGPPPVVKITGTGGAIPWKKRTWVIDAIDWGAALMNKSGNRVRQAAKITFLEFISDELLDFSSPAIARRAKARKKPKAKKAKKKH